MDSLNERNTILDMIYEDIEEQKISIGEIQKVLFSIIASIVAIGQLAPNVQTIKA